jgi:hypothetical protein
VHALREKPSLRRHRIQLRKPELSRNLFGYGDTTALIEIVSAREAERTPHDWQSAARSRYGCRRPP